MINRTWTLCLSLERNPEYYYFDSSNWDVSVEELSLCIDKQIYSDEWWTKQKEKEDEVGK